VQKAHQTREYKWI